MAVKIREKVKGSGEWWLFINHKGRRKAVKVGSKEAAKASAVKIEKGLAAGKVNLGPVKRVFFKDQYKTWIGQHVGLSCEMSTVETYEDVWKNHVKDHFGNLTLDVIDREKIREFFRVKKEQGYAKSTIKGMRSVISGVIELAIEDKLMDVNPTLKTGKYLKDAKAKRKAEFLSAAEGKLLLVAVTTRYRALYPFFLTALRTGLRQGELIGLKWDDVDWNSRFLTVNRTIYRKKDKVPKCGKSRKVDMSDQLLVVLRDHKKAMAAESLKAGKGTSEYVFTTRNQTTFEPDWIRRVFTSCLKAAGLRVVPFHALRHSFASALIGHGAPLAYVKEQMGHSSIQVTVDVYGHLIPGANREEINKLDDPGYGAESATPAQPATRARVINSIYSGSLGVSPAISST